MMHNAAVLADGTARELEAWLPVSGCMARASLRGAGNRPALELFAGRSLIGVTVAGAFAARPVAAAIRGVRAGRPRRYWALALGSITDGGVPSAVAFASAHGARYVEPVVIAGTFWVAEEAGRFRSVAVGGYGAVRLCRTAVRT
jgi:hypothetical protein